MRSRARRRSVSIWLSPGPLVPMPPSIRPAPRRSRWVQSPRMRAMLYSSWASSTCSLPSAEWAWSAKMSRITAVRSITGTPSAASRLRSWRGASSSSQATRLASQAAICLLQLVQLAAAEVAVGVRRVALLDAPRRRWRRRRCAAAPSARRAGHRPRLRRRRCRSPGPAGGRAGWRRRRRCRRGESASLRPFLDRCTQSRL